MPLTEDQRVDHDLFQQIACHKSYRGDSKSVEVRLEQMFKIKGQIF